MIEVVAEPCEADVLFVADNLRERDRREILATQWTDSPEELAQAVMASGSFRWGVYVDGRPVAMIGAVPRWPNVWSMWAFGTDDFPSGFRALHKHAKRFMIPALVNHGAIRGDCWVLAENVDTRGWLESLGFTPGSPVDNWGRNGQTFILYSWLRKDLDCDAAAITHTGEKTPDVQPVRFD